MGRFVSEVKRWLIKVVIPAKAGISTSTQENIDREIPACAGMTGWVMELKDFIEYVLVDIAEGITAARDRVGDKIAINPHEVNGKLVTEKDYIAFDIAVSVNEQSEHLKQKGIKGGLRITVVSASANSAKEEKSGYASEKISRVSFKIPVYYNATFIKDKK